MSARKIIDHLDNFHDKLLLVLKAIKLKTFMMEFSSSQYHNILEALRSIVIHTRRNMYLTCISYVWTMTSLSVSIRKFGKGLIAVEAYSYIAYMIHYTYVHFINSSLMLREPRSSAST